MEMTISYERYDTLLEAMKKAGMRSQISVMYRFDNEVKVKLHLTQEEEAYLRLLL